MTTSGFWDNVLEADEKLLWAGQPKPRLHWRNWRLYGAAPIAAAALLATAWFIIFTTGSEGDMWLLVLPALMVFIPARAAWQQIKTYRATRYALTDKRALFFQVTDQETRVKAYPRNAMRPHQQRQTIPPSVTFLRPSGDKKPNIGFDFIETAPDLLPHLKRMMP